MELGLDAAEMRRVFPFHFAVDPSDLIIQLGPSMKKLVPRIGIGEPIGRFLDLYRGACADSIYETLTGVTASTLVVFQIKGARVLIRGQVGAVSSTRALFLGSPWIQEPESFRSLGLGLTDFAVSDPTLDALQTMQADRMAFSDFQDLTAGLKKQKVRLNRLNQELRAQNDELVATRDLLARREREARKLANVASLTTNAVAIADSDRRIEWVNASFELLTGHAFQDVLGADLNDFLAIEELGRGAVSSGGIDWSSGGRYETGRTRADGSRYWVELEVRPVKDEKGTPLSYIAVQWDITGRMEEAQALREAKQAAERANRAKSDFFATLSHEIRTPMNGVLGMADLLLGTELNDEQRDYAESVALSSRALLKVINDVLDLSKIEHGGVTLVAERFRLRDVVDEALDVLSYTSYSKGLELAALVDLDAPRTIVGDAGRLRQILLNLLGNAIKFTESGYVILRASAVGETGLRMEVEDSGIGLAGVDVETLFESFTQANTSSSRKYTGTGLGLSICKKLVEAMNGRLGGGANEGCPGASFWIELDSVRVCDDSASLSGGDHRAFIVGAPSFSRESVRLTFLGEGWSTRVFDVDVVDDDDEWNRALADSDCDFALFVALGDALDALSNGRVEAIRSQLKGKRVVSCIALPHAGGGARLSSDSRFDFEIELPICRTTPSTIVERDRNRRDAGLGRTASPDRPVERMVATEAQNGRRILLAEDHAINQKLAVSLLKKIGFDADLVVNGAEAVAAVRAREYDIVLMDCQMPEMDGFEATRRIRKLESENSWFQGRRHRIIAVTANAMPGDREQCFEAGMDDYLSKPITKEGLSEALERAFEEQPNNQQIQEEKMSEVRETLSQLVEDLGSESVGELIESFIEEAPDKLAEIDGLIQSGNLGRLREEAHSFKSVCGIYGLEGMRVGLQQIETSAKSGVSEGLGEAFDRVREDYVARAPALDEFRAAK